MEFDFSSYFDRYLALSKAADAVFDQVKESHPECVNCRVECSDCCHAIFDLTLIEALYLNHRFEERFSGKERE
ncbi:MAG: YkgJ family cysteine cluster protein, partial [Desulfobacterales bacterium]